jgi:hypothetical protein
MRKDKFRKVLNIALYCIPIYGLIRACRIDSPENIGIFLGIFLIHTCTYVTLLIVTLPTIVNLI